MPDAAGSPVFNTAEMRRKIRAIGTAISPETLGEAMKLYAPFHPGEPYQGVRLTRDIKYGPDERNRLDLFLPLALARDLPVMIYVHGGGFTGGDKKNPAFPYYDNVMLWAVRHGMAGVNITYRLAPKHKWPSGNQDIANVVLWIQRHGPEHGLDPKRVFLMGQSAGASHVAQYIAHPQYQPDGNPGIVAGLLVSGIYDIAHSHNNRVNKAYFGEDEKEWKIQTALPGLINFRLPLLITVAENDPPDFERQALSLLAGLYARDDRLPWFQRLWGHNHISAMLHVGLEKDDQLGDLILDFIATECPA